VTNTEYAMQSSSPGYTFVRFGVVGLADLRECSGGYGEARALQIADRGVVELWLHGVRVGSVHYWEPVLGRCRAAASRDCPVAYRVVAGQLEVAAFDPQCDFTTTPRIMSPVELTTLLVERSWSNTRGEDLLTGCRPTVAVALFAIVQGVPGTWATWHAAILFKWHRARRTDHDHS